MDFGRFKRHQGDGGADAPATDPPATLPEKIAPTEHKDDAAPAPAPAPPAPAPAGYKVLGTEEEVAWLRDVLQEAPLRDALTGDAPSRPGAVAALSAIADRLLRDTVLVIAGEPFHLIELEAYVRTSSAAHPDPFTHDDPIQRSFGRFYFHRVGKGYKGGSYKVRGYRPCAPTSVCSCVPVIGSVIIVVSCAPAPPLRRQGLDLTFGSPAYAAGFLIRGVAPLRGGAPIEGPCKVVDRILAGARAPSIVDFVAACGESVPPLGRTCAAGPSALFLAPALKPRASVCVCARARALSVCWC